MARYKFYTTPGLRVICVSSYAGRKVRGVAICSESDEYDMEKGKALAKARVDVEIARRRLHRANGRRSEAWEAEEKAELHREAMESYVDDAYDMFDEAKATLDELLSQF